MAEEFSKNTEESKPTNWSSLRELDETDVRVLRIIQRKYATTFKDFFTKLYVDFKGVKGKKKLEELVHKIEEFDGMVNYVLQGTKAGLTRKDIERLQFLMKEVDDGFKFFSNPDNISEGMVEQLKKTEDEFGTSAAEITKQSAVLRSRLVKTTKPRFRIPGAGLVGDILSPVAQPIAGALGEAAKAALGPFGEIGLTAGKAVGGVVGGIAGRIKARRRKLADAALSRAALTPDEDTKESFENMFQSVQGLGRGKISENLAGGFGIGGMGGVPMRGVGGETAYPFGGGVGGGGALPKNFVAAQKEMMAASLFTFFSGPAFRAQWTKQLLEAIQGKVTPGFKVGGGTKEREGGALQDILGGVVGGALAKKLIAGAILTTGVGLGLGLLGTGAGMSVVDAINAQKRAKEQGWLRKPGEELATGQKVAAGIGGVVGGAGPGVMDKGTVGAKAGNIGWGMLKGGTIGAGIGILGAIAAAPFTGGLTLAAIPGILAAAGTAGAIGAGVGGLTHALGGQKISQGLQGATRLLHGQRPSTGEQFPIIHNMFEQFKEGQKNLERIFKEQTDNMIEQMKKMQAPGDGSTNRLQSGNAAFDSGDVIASQFNHGFGDLAG